MYSRINISLHRARNPISTHKKAINEDSTIFEPPITTYVNDNKIVGSTITKKKWKNVS